MRVFVHIGYPRCASSFLQNQVFSNFKNLSYLGPKGTNLGSLHIDQETLNWLAENFALVQGLSSSELLEFSTIAGLVQTIDGRDILISSERYTYFYNYANNFDDIRCLLCILKALSLPVELTFVALIRSQDKAIKSLYYHSYPEISKYLGIFKFRDLKRMGSPIIDVNNCNLKIFLKNYDYFSFFYRLKCLFPGSRLMVFNFDSLIRRELDFFHEFFGIFNEERDPCLEFSRENNSLSSNLLFEITPRFVIVSVKKIFRFFGISRPVRSVFSRIRLHKVDTENTEQLIREFYRASNDALSRRRLKGSIEHDKDWISFEFRK